MQLEQTINRPERLGQAQRYAAQTARREAQRIVLLAIEYLNADHAAINVITQDGQVTISSTDVAVDAPGAIRPREQSWCQHVIAIGDVLAVREGRSHALVAGTEPAISGEVASYLGYPIVVQGEIVGALCVYDDLPREWTELDSRRLGQLAEAAADAGKTTTWISPNT